MSETPAPRRYDPVRAQQLVRNKMKFRYGVEGEQLKMAETMRAVYDDACNREMDNSNWFDRLVSVTVGSHIPTAQIDPLYEIIHESLNAYGDAFIARRALSRKHDTAFAPADDQNRFVAAVTEKGSPDLQAYSEDSRIRRELGDAYVNHISNTTQQKLQEFGFTPADAFKLHGQIIKVAVHAYVSTTHEVVNVFPLQAKNSSRLPQNGPQTVEKNIERLTNYWQEAEEHMRDIAKQYTPVSAR